MNEFPIISIVGRSNSGKTMLIEGLIPEFKRRKYSIGIVKHHAHDNFDIDIPGKDTWRHAQAGADAVVLSSPGKMFMVRKTAVDLKLEYIKTMMDHVDIILTEGFKWEKYPKIEVIRSENSKNPICNRQDLIAVASDLSFEIDIPLFSLVDYKGIVDFIEKNYLKRK